MPGNTAAMGERVRKNRHSSTSNEPAVPKSRICVGSRMFSGRLAVKSSVTLS